eukprot:CAMPEP_0119050152 /NCGR_PEP_ID=MMETSP1177-20130426/68441_1 /TAXON_ID=2985 /ORGANISM="Ochromonas sp, Strain CCMP1899" /LENGTH=76 /DNA_ID=CAMNT_0007028223 /DNA_START=126 /DNA_END=356 /DNA_ORIENTATION=-
MTGVLYSYISNTLISAPEPNNSLDTPKYSISEFTHPCRGYKPPKPGRFTSALWSMSPDTRDILPWEHAYCKQVIPV